MKVTRSESFTPITIVIETAEEANMLLHRLDMDTAEVAKSQGSYNTFNPTLDDRISSELWHEVEKHHSINPF